MTVTVIIYFHYVEISYLKLLAKQKYLFTSKMGNNKGNYSSNIQIKIHVCSVHAAAADQCINTEKLPVSSPEKVIFRLFDLYSEV